MIILDIPRRTPQNGAFVDIPVYHRTHLGLSQDTAVHYCVLPARPSPHTGDPAGSAPELVVAPFPFEIWGEIWRLTTTMTDKSGLLYEISDTMREFGVNILASESTTMEERGMYHVEMILHIPDEQKVPDIEWTLLARLFEHVEFLPNGNPRVRIKPLRNLWRVKESYDRLSLLGRSKGHVMAFRPQRDKTKVELLSGSPNRPRSLRLRLPDKVRKVLKSTVASSSNDWGYYLRISDTKDRFLRVLYFRSSDSVLHARVEHDDQIGSYASITRALRDANFTLLTALTTPSEAGGRTFSEFVVRLMDVETASTNETKNAFERALSSSPAAKDLDFKIGYPSGYAAAWEKKPLRYIRADDSAEQAADDAAETNLVEMLHLQHRTLGRRLQDGRLPSALERNRWGLANQLLNRHAQITQQRQHAALFISCHYEGNQLQVARRVAEEMGFVVITGENLERFPNVVGGLIDRVQSCSDFLGIWSEAGAKRVGAEYSPSPWLLWELGVAAAFRINWRLLISKAISKETWAKLDASRQHVLYDETNFESKLRVALSAFGESSQDVTGASGRSF